MRKTAKERFMEKTNTEGSCWVWIGGKLKGGYGQFSYEGKGLSAHRASYMLFVGEIGDKHVLHKCDNPSCVNPDHLFLGYPKDNSDDKVSKNRQLKGESNARSKLSDDEVRLIRAWSSSGMSVRSISDVFGVSPMNVSFINRNLRWTHV
jgi:hypothetical protein